MKRQILSLVLLVVTGTQAFSQIVFENGYFVNDSNQRIECLIKNRDWKNNPTKFEYKLSADGQTQKASIETVKEFAIHGASKFIRATVGIDRSPSEVHKLSSEKNPNFLTERIFLKVLIEGKATLYLYTDGSLIRFFYKVDDSNVKQLVYKRFLVGDIVDSNNSFRQQLFLDLKCPSIVASDFETLEYRQRELMRLFMRFNECTNSTYTNYETKDKKDLFNLSLRPGLNYSQLTLYSVDAHEITFEDRPGFRFGVEAEFILPFNKNKWGIIVEPTYQSYSQTTENPAALVGGVMRSEVDYQSIEVPTGARHYFFLDEKSTVFLDLCYVVDFSANSAVTFSRNDGSLVNSLEVESRSNWALGAGYKYAGRYSLSLRYQTGREILVNYLAWNSSYKTLSVVVGYSLW